MIISEEIIKPIEILEPEEIAWLSNTNFSKSDHVTQYLRYLETQARIAVETQTNFSLVKKRITGRHINTSIPITYKPFSDTQTVSVKLITNKNKDGQKVACDVVFGQTRSNGYIIVNVSKLTDEQKIMLGINNTNIIENQRKYFKESKYYFEFSYVVGPDDPKKILTVHKNLLIKYIKFFASSSDNGKLLSQDISQYKSYNPLIISKI